MTYYKKEWKIILTLELADKYLKIAVKCTLKTIGKT